MTAAPAGRIFSYARVSSAGQVGEDRDGLDRQVAAAMAWCEAHGRQLEPPLTDAGVSAFRGRNRAAGVLGRFLAAARDGDTLLIEDLDRFSRSAPLDTIETLIGDVVRAGITIVVLRDGLTINRATLQDDLGTWVRLLAAVHGAHAFSQKLSERVTSARKAELKAMRAGEDRRTNTRPFWIDHGPGGFVLNDQAAIVRQMFAWCIEKDWGCNRIARQLDADGHRTPRGGRWSTRAVLNTLTNPATIGLYQPHRIEHIDGQKKRVPEGNPFPRYPAVVSPGRLEVARQRIAGRRRTGGQKTSLRSPLQDLVTCSCCSKPITVTSSATGGRRYEYARCGIGQYSKAICGGPLRLVDLIAVVLTSLPAHGWQQFFPQGEDQKLAASRRQLQEAEESLVALQREHRNLLDAVTRAAAGGQDALSLMLTLQQGADEKKKEADQQDAVVHLLRASIEEVTSRTPPEQQWQELLCHVKDVMKAFGCGTDTVEDRIALHDRLVAMGMRFEIDLSISLLTICWNGAERAVVNFPDVAIYFLHRGEVSGLAAPTHGDWAEQHDADWRACVDEMDELMRSGKPLPTPAFIDFPAKAAAIRTLVAEQKHQQSD